MRDPLLRFCRAEFGITSSHAFHAHEPHGLTVEVESSIQNFQLAHTKKRRERVDLAFRRNRKVKAVEMGMIKVPKSGLGQNSMQG